MGIRPWQAVVKRVIDIVLGVAGLVVLLPVALIVAAAIALDSSGPII
jgi:lipopolysaccharide/colanic/teichoic acid biosynthesis glycosyltransferase